MKVNDFAEYAERIDRTNSRIEKQDIVWEAIQSAKRPKAEDAILAFTTNQRFDDCGVAKTTVKNALSGADIPPESEHGDLPSAIAASAGVQSSLTPREDVLLTTLYADLEHIEGLTETSAIEDKIRQMFNDYKSPKWVAHALLGDDGVSLGFGVKSAAKMIRRYHDDVTQEEMEKARALCPDVIELHNRAPDVPLSPVIGQPFKPMLANDEGLPSEPGDDWIVQPKYDGARVLVHYDQGDYWIFSRNLNDVTDSLPEIESVVDRLHDDARVIIDGEAVAYKDGEQQDFQYIMTRFNRKHGVDEQEIDVRFNWFDCVYAEHPDLDGWADGDLSDEPNYYRLKVLNALFPYLAFDAPSVASLDTVTDPEEIQELYDQYVHKGYEGAIVKRASVPYEYDKYSHDWIKMKDMKDNADLIITEIIEGEDSRAGKMGAVRLETSDGVEVGKVGTGFSEEDEEWFWENRHELLGRVMEVEWQEIQQDEDGNWGLRFPVHIAVRSKDEADSLEDMKSA